MDPEHSIIKELTVSMFILVIRTQTENLVHTKYSWNHATKGTYS